MTDDIQVRSHTRGKPLPKPDGDASGDVEMAPEFAKGTLVPRESPAAKKGVEILRTTGSDKQTGVTIVRRDH